jgi:co-chaperonin GroES (HSP10)
MKSVNFIIVEVEEAYNNEKKIGDVSIVVNSTIESVEHINRIAKVITSPSFTPLKEGDEVIIHHNICRLRNGTKGGKVQSDYHIEGNKYFVPLTEVFMYRRDGDWIALAPYCFVEPIKDETKMIGSIIVPNSGETHKGMISHEGIMKYSNPELNEYGINNDDHISFSEDSEYEFMIDGKIYYKMATRDILGKFD